MKNPNKSKVCPFCTPTMDNVPLNEGTCLLSMLEMKIIGRGRVLRVRSLTRDGLYASQDMVILHYCPMCGRNLDTNEPACTSTGV